MKFFGNKTPVNPVLYCIVLYCIVLYCIVLYCIVLYCIVLYCIVLYCIVLYCIVLYCIVLYCIVLYCTVFNDCLAICKYSRYCVKFYEYLIEDTFGTIGLLARFGF